jgi:hypothetical protein
MSDDNHVHVEAGVCGNSNILNVPHDESESLVDFSTYHPGVVDNYVYEITPFGVLLGTQDPSDFMTEQEFFNEY